MDTPAIRKQKHDIRLHSAANGGVLVSPVIFSGRERTMYGPKPKLPEVI